MFTLALALSFIQPADACAMPRYEAPIVAKAEPGKVNKVAEKAPEPKAPATLEDALAEIDGAAIAEVPAAPVAPAPAAELNKQAAAEPRT